MKRALVYALIPLFFIPAFAKADVRMAYFYSDDCQMCHEMEPFIEEIENYSFVEIEKYKVSRSPFQYKENNSLFENISYAYKSPMDIPVLFVANAWFYLGDEKKVEKQKEKILEIIEELKNYDVEYPIKDGKIIYPKPVSIILFYNSSKNEPVENIETTMEKNIKFLRMDKIDVSRKENESIFRKFNGNETPLIVIGEKSYPLSLYNLSYVVEEAKKYELLGIEFPPKYVEKKICIVFFYTSTCPSCMRMKARLEALSNIYPLDIKEYDTVEKKNRELLLEYGAAYNITRYHSANIFIGNKYFYSEVQFSELEKEIKSHLGSGIPCPSVGEVNKESLLSNILLFVIIGGLLDGINPCAFATIIFFIAYMERMRRNALLLVGLSFTIGIYISYLLIGLGLLEFLNVIRKFVSIYLDIAIGISALVIGAFNIMDFFAVRKGRTAVLQLPMFIKKRRGRIIGKIAEDRKVSILAIIAFSAGFAISALEFACTGQILLPVITVIESSSSLRIIAFIYLLIYNLMFVLPLLLILFLFHKGKSSATMGEEHMKKYAYTKLLIGIFLILLAFFMLNHVFGWIESI